MDTIFDYIEPFEKFLMILNSNSIATDDFKYIPMYRQYLVLRYVEKRKYYDCIETLAAQFGYTNATVRRKIKKFSQRLKS